MAIEDEHAVETFKSLIQISLAGLKLLALFNGGAAVALLAYLGNVAGKGSTVPDMSCPMLLYVIGLVSCGIAFFLAYLTQLRLYSESVGHSTGERYHYFQIACAAFALLSLAAFAVGSFKAATGFANLAYRSPSGDMAM